MVTNGKPGDHDEALQTLLTHLAASGYAFVTPTPLTHARVLARRAEEQARDLRDVLGWSLPFRKGAIDPEVERLLEAGGALHHEGDNRRTTLRVSSLRGRLYFHSAYPTIADDAVFFGPDSYRFAAFLAAELPRDPPSPAIVDLGCGAGVGAIVAADLIPAARIAITDVNGAALRLARINARAAGHNLEPIHGDILGDHRGMIDIALANPPFMADAEGRHYRDGGGSHGAALSIRMIAAVLPRLAPGGRLLLYSGTAIVGGHDAMRAAAHDLARAHGASLSYCEIDPDIFGEELAKPAYHDVERIAAIGAVFVRPAGPAAQQPMARAGSSPYLKGQEDMA